MIDPKRGPYPVYEAPNDNRFDAHLPRVRESLVRSARAAIKAGVPMLPEAREALATEDPDTAALLGVASSDGEARVPVSEITEREREAWRLDTAGSYGGGHRHSSGARGFAIVYNDYHGNNLGE